MKEDRAATAAKSSPEWRSCRETNEGRQGGAGSQEQPRMETMQGDKWRETRRRRQPRAAQNGDHAGRQMKGDKAATAAKSSPEWRSCRGQMKGGKAAGKAKSRPEWRSCRETNEGRQGGSSEWRSCREKNEGRQGGNGSQEQPRMEIMQGDKWRETRRQQGGSGITTIWRLWGSATQSLRSKNPYSFQLSGEKNIKHQYRQTSTSVTLSTRSSQKHAKAKDLKTPTSQALWFISAMNWNRRGN